METLCLLQWTVFTKGQDHTLECVKSKSFVTTHLPISPVWYKNTLPWKKTFKLCHSLPTPPLLYTANSTGLTGCPSALYVCRGYLTSWCLSIRWISLQIMLNDIANKIILKSHISDNKLRIVPWSNDACKQAIIELPVVIKFLVVDWAQITTNYISNNARKLNKSCFTISRSKLYSPSNN